MGDSVRRISIENVPEALAAIRREMSKLLRREADIERDHVMATKLRTLAHAFEAGLGPANDDIWRKRGEE